jgi:hypothetical protein
MRYVELPITVTERSKAWNVFAHPNTGIVGSNPTQDMGVWYVHEFILCLCYPVFREEPCDELITRPRSNAVCKNDYGTDKEDRALNGLEEPLKEILSLRIC